MSVVVEMDGQHRLIAKGAPEEIMSRCTKFELDGQVLPIEPVIVADLREEYLDLNTDGFRVLALAYQRFHAEGGLQQGRRVRPGAARLRGLPRSAQGVGPRGHRGGLRGTACGVKVLTGDNDLVTRKICHEVGLDADHIVLGNDVEKMSDQQLAEAAEGASIFARLSPAHKRRVILALKSRGHVVGYLGDGINDAPALRAADVGISVDTAVDIAREAADIILLEKSLMVLEDGVIEGRKIFANIVKYIKMGASSNFGNMFSMLGASILLPFYPILPLQLLTNNLLYDVSQVPIPTDEVDPEFVARPRAWSMGELTRFILFMGPVSSIFDYTTFAMMWWFFHCPRQQRGRHAVPDRLVRGIAADADVDHPHHPHQQDSLHRKPRQLALDLDDGPGDGLRHCPAVFAAARIPGNGAAAVVVLALAGPDVARLCGHRPGR